jgi:hypothetical protein
VSRLEIVTSSQRRDLNDQVRETFRAKMAFPDTGEYVVPDALDLVSISREEDRGVYAETNLWMRHL